MLDQLLQWLAWFSELPDGQQNLVVAAVSLALSLLIPEVRGLVVRSLKRFRRVVFWRGSAVKVLIPAPPARFSGSGRHFIVFPDLSLTNRHTDPESVSCSLRVTLLAARGVETIPPESTTIPSLDRTGWFRRNTLLTFPLYLNGKQSVQGHVAFCISSEIEVPMLPNVGSFVLQFRDATTEKVFTTHSHEVSTAVGTFEAGLEAIS